LKVNIKKQTKEYAEQKLKETLSPSKENSNDAVSTGSDGNIDPRETKKQAHLQNNIAVVV
jgi:hypothetical protein